MPRQLGLLLAAALVQVCLVGCPGDAAVRRDGGGADVLRRDLANTSDGSGPRDLAADQSPVDGPQGDTAVDATTPDLGSDQGQQKPPLEVLILAGQSNMVGLGINSQLSAAEKGKVADVRIYYNASVHPNANAKKWRDLEPGFGVTVQRFGPELSFGRQLRKRWPQRKLAIIKVAEGGTALHDRWAAGTGDLYQLLVAEVKAQLKKLRKDHPSFEPRLSALCWMQGESDAISSGHAAAYQQRFTAFVGALRQDLAAPGLPAVAGLIAPQGGWPHAATVRQATVAVSRALSPMEVVETNDLTMHANDVAHYDSASNLILGRRFADAVAAMHATSWSFPADFDDNQYNWGWSYWDRKGGSSTRMVFKRQQSWFEGAEPFQVVASGFMHPGPSRDAELVFTAPRTATYTISADAEAGNNGGGDGTVVSIYKDSALVWGPQAVPNNTKRRYTGALVLQQGQRLLFRTNAGAVGDSTYDTTLWKVSIVP